MKKYPLTHILNPKFCYVPAAKTNIAATFARIRAEIAARGTSNAVPLRKKREAA